MHTQGVTSWKTFGFRTGASLKLKLPNWWHLSELFELVGPIGSRKPNCVGTGPRFSELVPNYVVPNWFPTFRTGFKLSELVRNHFQTTSAPGNNTQTNTWLPMFPNWLIQVSELQLVGKHSFRTKPIHFQLFELVSSWV